MMSWAEAGKTCTAHWRSESGVTAPKRVKVADDTMKADEAYRLACEGTALLWRGDFQNARQLLVAMSRRADHKPRKAASVPSEVFNLHRQAQSQRARTLGMLLIPLDGHYTIPLRRAPDVQAACQAVYGEHGTSSVVSLRELLGLIGASEWRKKGVEIPVLGGRIYPHYGVFSPVRGEYVALVNDTPLPALDLAFDIGTGTGVLAAVLARRGVKRVIATDQDPRALACARENLAQLGLGGAVDVQPANLFPEGRAPLIVCNPPWIPARPSSPIEYAIFDPNSQMLRGFLAGLTAHLTPNGEGWLILSDIAEHLGLRTRETLLTWIAEAGLQVVARIEVRPQHSKAADPTDPLHAARAAERTSLWRLAAQ
ncbi:MAG: class I SAM-dependent methyltransferase [Gallionella sp.]|nr:class I SAM-dependent methyltransferase [Gallionella sp.]MDD4963894.1 class I SAM-dependent methyltransferase [Gallionella sp.]